MKMWEKIMKEVKDSRVAGLYDTVPFDNYIQSPVGLVPKSGGKTRLIFHLSYDFPSATETEGSLNSWTPRKLCTVKYNDLDEAVRECLRLVKAMKDLQPSDISSLEATCCEGDNTADRERSSLKKILHKILLSFEERQIFPVLPGCYRF